MDQVIDYSDEILKIIQIAQTKAREYRNVHFSAPHLLYGVLHASTDNLGFLEAMDKDVNYLKEWAEVRIESLPKSTNIPDEPGGDESIGLVFEEAEIIRLKLAFDELNEVCLLSAICKPNLVFSKDQLKSFPLTLGEIMDYFQKQSFITGNITPASPQSNIREGKSPAKLKAVNKYCVDKTSLAREGQLDDIIGREGEMRMMIEILARRSKPNVIVVGDPGVGKSALVDGLALNIVHKKVPDIIKSSLLLELDLGTLVAGASYKGEVEDRLKNIIKEIKSLDKAILFIDEIHALVDPKGSLAGAANLLKPELTKGAITVIGATTMDEYRKYIETDSAFSRRFEVLHVDEPDLKAAFRMVKKVSDHYKAHHQIEITEDAISETVILAKRYIKDRKLPDAAIDLMDRTMAAIKMMNESSAKTIEDLEMELVKIHDNGVKDKFSELQWFHIQLRHKISPILFGELEDDQNEVDLKEYENLYQYLTQLIRQLKNQSETHKEVVDKLEVAAIVAYKTGIPIGKIQAQEREKLLQMEDQLRKRVVGQDAAIKVISDAILESRSGLARAGQPIGSFFFLGPTGTGKTELAKSLAEFLFNDENMLIRFDMSEFKEEHSAAVLLGAPAGYVGFEEGGILVNKIREKPYSVVLFDEIEKAHSSVFDIFLQIMDEGKLHDRLGKEGDFSNAVVLFTSNIGSHFIIKEVKEEGCLPTSNELMEIMSGHFRPEFLARVTEIVPFSPILEENVVKIFDIHLKKLLKQLEVKGIQLEIEDEAKKQLALSGFTPEYGARPLAGVIRNQLRRPISRMIIAESVNAGNFIHLSLNKEEIKWTVN